MCGNGSAVILRIKIVEPSLELQIFYVQHGKKRLWNTLSAFNYSVVGKSFLVIAKCIREKFLDPWQDIYPWLQDLFRSIGVEVSHSTPVYSSVGIFPAKASVMFSTAVLKDCL